MNRERFIQYPFSRRCSAQRRLRRLPLWWLLIAFGTAVSLSTAADRQVCVAQEALSAPQPVAHWRCDAQPLTATSAVPGAAASLAVDAKGAVEEIRGVHGRAVSLTGSHQLRVTIDAILEELNQLTFSAWVRPRDLSSYREIFRQECPRRLLFSFQHGGRILSLGLHVGGYVECDAEVNPAEVLDGQWHHCAATFDGRTMRVYFDGRLIGQLDRPGPLATQLGIPAFIGSSSGRGEFWQGDLDDLRIYNVALGDEDVRALYRGGLESLATAAEELAKVLDRFYVPGESLAETLVETRQKRLELGDPVDREAYGVLAIRLKVRFPEAYDRFIRWWPGGVTDFVDASNGDRCRDVLDHMMELLTEYEPVTEQQRARQSAAERLRSERITQLKRRYDGLRKTGDKMVASPASVELLLTMSEMIRERPHTREAVAPYVKPVTPATRRLTADEADQRLRQDWLFQADGRPTKERILEEIEWSGQLIDRIENDGGLKGQAAAFRAQLRDLRARADRVTGMDEALYLEVRRIKRRVMMSNPVLDFRSILLVDSPYPQGSEWRHETRHRLGYMAVPGGRLLVLDGLSPDAKVRQLMPKPPLHGSFWRPDLSYDARRVVFCFKPHNEKSFHVYEIGIDGDGLRQITDGPYDDLDPIYLPDQEHVLFSTTRGHTYVRCMPPTNAFVLARCNLDGSRIYLVSRNNEPDYLPSVMPDGRVIYTRWEYTDKPLWRAQSLWTMNPDGTGVRTFWGNQSVWPDLLKDARAIPGSHRVMFTGSAHHDWFSGSVGIIDPRKGSNFPDGLTKVTADVPWPECGNGPVDPVESPRYHGAGKFGAYYSPYPLSEKDFLVSAQRDGKFRLYLMDVDGNRELIYEGAHNVFYAQPIRARPIPRSVPDKVAWPTPETRDSPKPGVLYSSNVFEGTPPVLRKRARYLRVLSIDPKTYTYWYKRPYISTGPVVSIVQSEGVKRIFGTVPIEKDGSVAFTVPSGKALHFQLLDDQYRALQTMRSFTGVMPGEQRGCQGCHESHSRTPEPDYRHALAFQQPPRSITPPPWPDRTVSFDRYVQPVLDRYCGKCHQGEGEARSVLDLTRRPGFLMFDEPYVTLTGKPTWGQPYKPPEKPIPGWGIAGTLMVEAYDKTDPVAYRTPEPMTALSCRSPLIDLASSGRHYEVRLDPISLRRLILWVDTMCPYRGEEEVRCIPDPEFQGVDWLAIRPKIQTAPRIVRPGPVKEADR